MSDISTWHERAMAHPDHQSGMISEEMIRARMGEEIADLRAEIDRLHRAHQTACEGGDLLCAEIKRLTRERDEARAEVESLREALTIAAGYVRYCHDAWHLTRDRAEALRDLTKIRAVLNDERAGELEAKS